MLSLQTSAASTLLCILVGVPMAVVLARTEFRGQGVVRSLVLLPLVLPPVVGGLALLYTFGRRGLLGESLDALGVQIAFSTIAVVMAQTFVALPFLVISIEGALRTAGERYEVVAASLGAPADHGLPPDHAAAGHARPGVRCGARLRALARRVRCDDHVRGQPAGCHPDAAARDLPPARDRPRRGGRARPRARRGRGAGDRGRPPEQDARCEPRAGRRGRGSRGRGGPVRRGRTRRSRSSAPTARASRRCSPWSPGWCGRTGAGSSSTAGS